MVCPDKANSDLPRKVVMLYSLSFEPHEGWYRRAYNQAKTLVNAGYDVTVLAWDRGGSCVPEETRGNVQIVRFRIPAGIGVGPRKNALKHLRFHRQVRAYLKTHHFDIIHCFNVDTMPTGLLAAQRQGARAVLDLCEPDYYRGFWSRRYDWLLHGVNWIEKTLAKRFDHVFVHNTYQLEKFRACGIDRMTQVGSYPNRSLMAKDVKQTNSETVTIGRLGTVYAHNGYEELLLAFQMLLDRQSQDQRGPQYKLRIAGNVFDTYRSTFQKLIEPFGDCIEVTGAFDAAELPTLYREIDISLVLQGSERFSNVTPTKLFDSMACGVPVVANAIGDVARIVQEGNCGVIVDEKDPKSICDGIERLAMNPDLRRKMANNAVRLAREKYTWEAVEDDFLAVYQGLSCDFV